MKDPNILYDYIWSQEELDPFRKMYDNWKGELMDPSVKRGDRHVWIIDDIYPDPVSYTHLTLPTILRV